jgi:hypothetical protein
MLDNAAQRSVEDRGTPVETSSYVADLKVMGQLSDLSLRYVHGALDARSQARLVDCFRVCRNPTAQPSYRFFTP